MIPFIPKQISQDSKEIKMKSFNFLFLLFCLLLSVRDVSAQNTTPAAQSSGNQASQPVKYPEVRAELLKRLKAARDVRSELVKKYNGMIPSAEMGAITKIDQENAVWIKTAVKEYGWPGKSLVGEDGEEAAFKLTMLAVQDQEFQKQCLELLQKAVKEGEAPADQPTLLADRMRQAGGGGNLSANQNSLQAQKTNPVPVQSANNQTGSQTMQAVKNPELRDEILQRFKSDQAVRIEAVKNYPAGQKLPQELTDRFKAIDKENTARMKEIIRQYGFPGYALVGPEAANAAFIIVQHADQDLAFQKQCLELLRKAVELKDIFPASVAYLTDRINVAEGKPQLYGTQTSVSPEGKFGVPPIEDEANVDKRRAAVGLEPLANYLERMRQKYSKPSN